MYDLVHMKTVEIDVVLAAAGISLSLLLVQVLHRRPSSLLTHGGCSVLLGMSINLAVWLASSETGSPQVISIVASRFTHDWMCATSRSTL
jgi:hypothetical protein